MDSHRFRETIPYQVSIVFLNFGICKSREEKHSFDWLGNDESRNDPLGDGTVSKAAGIRSTCGTSRSTWCAMRDDYSRDIRPLEPPTESERVLHQSHRFAKTSLDWPRLAMNRRGCEGPSRSVVKLRTGFRNDLFVGDGETGTVSVQNELTRWRRVQRRKMHL